MKLQALSRLMRFWPPFLGAGIKVTSANDSLTELSVEMKLRFWNRNYVGTQYGGSLYSMVDPFYALMLMENLGKRYIVWDKSASIQFKNPGRGKVFATFTLTGQQIQEIREAADEQEKTEPAFQVQITDSSGMVVAVVDKLLYVKRKDKVSADAKASAKVKNQES